MSHDDDVKLIKQSITYGADAPTDVIERIGVERTYALISSALTLAVQRKFSPTATVDEIGQYAKGLPARFPEGQGEIVPSKAEAVIRAARGELAALQPLSHSDILGMMFLVTYAIMSHENLRGDLLDAYVDDVLSMASAN
ncbi:MAG TPA: hypothetical protein VE172_09175 [Stackebrandtia sp.]|jgi:hypothetical protein|uniref:hypothetical protein n=1 Tax=Stackebrandtia sp. TaxID=2023065 RepID=UPI002D39B8E0|nr:hypothetical protein [Stackebrandtia sp.]HZE38968.1 hypothetical protein [Stackebrandtia sp.]